MSMVTKLSDVSDIVKQTINDPQQSFPVILELANSEDWKEREVAATILVEGSKKKPVEIVAEMILWADHSNLNVRRTASEGLRDVARKKPELVLPVIAKLKDDPNIYVKKSVANVLRNAGNYHAEFVLKICEEWAHGKKFSYRLDYQRWFEKTQSKIPGESGRDNCFVRPARRITNQ
jgi:3-methyladenine DNA glycosylase AlkC